ncbi:MAG: methionyl-tRNA formyltransferase [Rhodobacteraceae bacterium]|nr:methionyl-tRNA formyltransferase [Paracoccaceae bacterium]
MRIVFMGTPEFAVPPLNALVAAGHEIAAVYCQPQRPAGRGRKPRPSPVEMRARDLGIEVRSPVSFSSESDILAFKSLDAAVAVVVAYGLILPPRLLSAPPRGCLNIHASLLPRWRGAAPIHRAIMAGDEETGISVMQMEAGLDTGPVLMQMKTAISPSDTTASLLDRLAAMGAEAIVRVLSELAGLVPVPQPEAGVTYAKKIDKAEARVDWKRPAVEIDRLIRALSPFPGAWSEIGGERLKFLDSRLSEGKGQPGEILLPGPRIACGTGAIELLRVQRAGRAAVTAAEFLRGFELKSGMRLD